MQCMAVYEGLDKSIHLCSISVINLIFVINYDALTELENHFASRTLYVFSNSELHREPGWRFVNSKIALNLPPPPHTHTHTVPPPAAIDCSKAWVLVLFLFYVAWWAFTKVRFMLCPALLFVLVFYSALSHCDHLAWGRKSWSMCFMSLFILNAFIYFLFLFFLLSACGSGSWLWHFLVFSGNFLVCEVQNIFLVH